MLYNVYMQNLSELEVLVLISYICPLQPISTCYSEMFIKLNCNDRLIYHSLIRDSKRHRKYSTFLKTVILVFVYCSVSCFKLGGLRTVTTYHMACRAG